MTTAISFGANVSADARAFIIGLRHDAGVPQDKLTAQERILYGNGKTIELSNEQCLSMASRLYQASMIANIEERVTKKHKKEGVSKQKKRKQEAKTEEQEGHQVQDEPKKTEETHVDTEALPLTQPVIVEHETQAIAS
jgi:FKBP-type peptidyl-prolyl cis-trans isomerase